MSSTVTLLPVTRSHQSRATVQHPSTPLQEHGRTYTSNANFNGSDSFTVTVTDDEGHTEIQVINLIVDISK